MLLTFEEYWASKFMKIWTSLFVARIENVFCAKVFQGFYETSKRTCTKLFNRESDISAQVGNGMLNFVSSDGTYNFIIHSSKLKSSFMRKWSHVVCPNSILSQCEFVSFNWFYFDNINENYGFGSH